MRATPPHRQRVFMQQRLTSPRRTRGPVVGRPIRNAVLRLVPGMDLRLHPCSVTPAERPQKCGPSRPTGRGSSCNNATQRRGHDGQVKQGEQEILHARDRVGQTSGATQRGLNPGFSERIGNSRRTGGWSRRGRAVIPIARWSSTATASPSAAGARRAACQAPRNGASSLDAARELGIRDAQATRRRVNRRV